MEIETGGWFQYCYVAFYNIWNISNTQVETVPSSV